MTGLLEVARREIEERRLYLAGSLLLGLLPLGAGVFGSELAERRLGFYFSRPIAGWAILAGKLGGAVVVALSAAALVLLPTAWRAC